MLGSCFAQLEMKPQNMHESLPDDTDWNDPDDALAARIADAVLELARKPGTHRLAAMQMAGLAGERPTQEDIARAFNISIRNARTLERLALAFIRWKHPELREELHAIHPGERSDGTNAGRPGWNSFHQD